MQVYAFLADHGVQLGVAVAVSRLYSAHPEVLPHKDKWTEFTLLVVKLMAGYSLNSATTTEDRERFAADAEEVSKMLPLIWGRWGTVGTVFCKEKWAMGIRSDLSRKLFV